MDVSSALPTFAIALREGVEAALVVGIVLACLQKANRSYLNSWVYAGIGMGIAASAFVGVGLGWITQAIANSSQPYAPVIKQLLQVGFSTIAIVMLSWMLIWMTKQSKSIKAEVEGAISATLKPDGDNSAGWGVFALIFIAVLREGFETVLFILAKFQQGWIPVFGALGGLAVAAGIGVLLFEWGVKINLRLFFQAMGVLLLLIVGGLVISALKHLDLAVAILARMQSKFTYLCFSQPSCILGAMVWNTTEILPDDRFPGLILKTLFGYTDELYVLQAVVYALFLLAIGGIYFFSLSDRQGKLG
jgi:high-affinity iron transporter